MYLDRYYVSIEVLLTKDQKDKVDQVVELLQRIVTIKKVGELKYFLGLHVICNQIKRTI